MTKEEQRTRDRLIEAALAEIVERGWGGVRSRNVAERAGVNNALVHYHFGSMDHLRLEAARVAFDRLAGSFGPDAVSAPTIAEGISSLAAELGSIDPGDPLWQVLMEVFVQSPRHPQLAEMAREVLEAFRDVLRTRLEAAVAEGELPSSADVDGLAVALIAMLDGLGLHAWVDPQIDARRAGAAVAHLLGGRYGEETS
jgi:AcrR family transcriptional regulator